MCLLTNKEIRSTCKRYGLIYEGRFVLDGKGETVVALVLSVKGTEELLTVRIDIPGPGLVNLSFYQISTAYEGDARKARDKFLSEQAKEQAELKAIESELQAPATTPPS